VLDVLAPIAFGAALATLAGVAAMLFAGFVAVKLRRALGALVGRLATLFALQLLLGASL